MSQGQEKQFPPQRQEQPGQTSKMQPVPETDDPRWIPSGKLKGKAALITGGDSGIGRAVATLFAKEGADIGIVYANEHQDAEDTKRAVENCGRRCILVPGDIGIESFCKEAVDKSVDFLGHLDILINNAAEQHVAESIENISAEQLEKTFRTNIFSMFFMVKAALPYFEQGSTVINTTSITAYEGNPRLLDYSSTKGAIVAFTRSLSQQLIERGIRVNAVAPGPIWTPLIPATFSEEHTEQFGANTPMKRAGQPREVAPCFLFLASDDSSYMSGQVLHPNGGKIVNG